MLNRNEPKTTIPVDEVTTILHASEVKPRQNGDLIHFRSHGLETRIRMAPCDLDTYDGLHLDQIISIRTDVPGLERFTPAMLGHLNSLAGLSALVRTGDRVSLSSRVSLYRGERSIQEYVFLIAMTALLQSIWPKQLAAYMTAQSAKEIPRADIPYESDPCRWTAADFHQVGEVLRARQNATTDDETGATSEFPWAPGAVSAMFHHRTSLFQIYAARNPLLGNGIFYKLELPATFEDEKVAGIAAAMNESEVNATDAPPFLGAWCSAKDGGRIAFVGFQPNLLRQIGMHTSVACWSLARSMASRDLLEQVAGSA